MRRMMLCLYLFLTLLIPVSAYAELGFAEVNRDNVNLRKTAGGDLIARLPANQSVFVFEETQHKQVTWCHVTTFIGKYTREGWIQSDMLRFLGEEFHDVVSVQAGKHYVTGLRGDGTVAIMGNDMRHAPCIDSVRSWRNIRDLSSWICEVYALDEQGTLHAAGRGRGWDGISCRQHPYTALSGHIPALLSDGVWISSAPDAVMRTDSLSVKYVSGLEEVLNVALTAEGKLLVFENDLTDTQSLQAATQAERFTACDIWWNHLILLREDGTVFGYSSVAPIQELDAWRDVAQVAAGNGFFLGLKADGTVLFAGNDSNHRRQVEAWQDVAQVRGGDGYSIALKKNGEVVMAGKYTGYDR